MRITDMIERLQEIIESDGDIEVHLAYSDDEGISSVALHVHDITIRHEPHVATGRKVVAIDA